MSDVATTTDAAAPPARKRRALPVLLGLVAAVALGGGAFYAVYTGLILAPVPPGTALAPVDDDFAHIPVDGITVTLAPDSGAQVLRFSGQIEVAQGSQADMERLQPRFLDLINTYLRAVAVDELTDPAAIIRLRAQLLRRLQVVAGEGHVRDLLITEFILQ
ncbi:MAG: flagellar basal body-associated FliL family protein [Rhodobacteraceae bacterium]|nr:flagellar basal body-associated FliL family protein [Paracoccaceae bacterium]TVR50164.1 MAG: flagellar basal body protein FliL [Paracoccaceae bacterium]